MREHTISRGLVVRNPFPGLRPFRTDEEHLFFGREQQVDRMVDKLAAHRFLAVVGSSGCGKSSLVNCGLRPALHRGYMARAGAAWRMAQLRPGSDPIGALAEALARPGVLWRRDTDVAAPDAAMVEATLRLGSLGLVDIVEQARLPAGTQLLLVVDQFEELFRYRLLAQGGDTTRPQAPAPAYGAGAEPTTFVRLLLEASAQTAVPVHVVLTMRSDFLGDCSQFFGLPEAINDSQYLVPRMSRDEIRAAIVGPVEVAKAELSARLLTRLLNDVGDNPDQLSILQHALNRSWAHWEHEGLAQGPLDLPHYEAVGGMAQALDRHAERCFAELGTARRQRVGERVFKALTDKGTDARGIRRPTRLDALCRIVDAPLDEVQSVLAVFRKASRSFLMPPLSEPLMPDSVIDISHESLMRVWQRLKRWAEDEAGAARVYHRLRESAALHEAGQAGLWRDPDLRVALDWHEHNAPTPAWAEQYHGGFDSAMAFLDRSRLKQRQEQMDAEIERRWLAGWHYVPLALVALPFVLLQLFLAGALQDWMSAAGSQRQFFASGIGKAMLEGASHLLAGVPAALAYVLLAPYIKTRFAQRLRRRLTLGAPAAARPEMATRAAGPDLSPAQAAGMAPAANASASSSTSAPGLALPPYARFWQRAGAAVTDGAILVGLCFITAMLAGSLATLLQGQQPTPQAVSAAVAEVAASARGSAAEGTMGPGAATEAGNEALGFLILLIWLLQFWLYHALCWASRHQATPGMRLAGLQLVDMKGRRLGFGRASGRHFARFLSYYTLGYGFLMQLFSARRQTLHDRLSGTLVLQHASRVAP